MNIFASFVAAIRSDPKVGYGTCSVVDECYSDRELEAALQEEKLESVHAAIRWAREKDYAHFSRGMNMLSGEESTDNWIRKGYQEAKANLKEVDSDIKY